MPAIHHSRLPVAGRRAVSRGRPRCEFGLATCLSVCVLAFSSIQISAAPQDIDDAQAASLAIRKLTGEHLILYTDVPVDPEVDALPRVFDRAFDSWRQFFHVEAPADWRMTGRLIRDRKSLPIFREAGLMPADVPDFRHGWSQDDNLWMYDQPTAYYRRHLLLHEGTHGFSQSLLAGTGPPWYMEGVAELVATHQWQDGQLTTGWFPPDKQQVEGWGRIKLVRDAVAARPALSIAEVMAFGWTAHREDEPYGWCWGAAAFLDGHPRYREKFKSLADVVREPNFNEIFIQRLGEDWPLLEREWPAFIADLEYGMDISRWAIDFAPGVPLPDVGGKATVAADKGWQSTKWRLEAGKKYRLRSKGRFQLGQKPKIWWSEPNGVSLRYYRGQPLGILLASLRPDDDAASPDQAEASPAQPSFTAPLVAGLEVELEPTSASTLYLRVNDSSAELADNVGALEVEIATAPVDAGE
jgi:hypothetical protein